jgi:pimeloyl-ACP methyl ester carboxylesterase
MAVPALSDTVLPRGLRARFLEGVNGLRVHVLEAGYQSEGRPCLLLLHGFPELAWSWRRVMPALADAGFHVVAPDQRGYGRTTGWDPRYDGDPASLGREQVAAVIGHDFGAPVAGWCALIRPDVFRATVLMSAPFEGPPARPFRRRDPAELDAALARLDPPRKHYQHFYATAAANADMWHCPQGVHDFLRAYYHHKSADWPGNRPAPLAAWQAGELARLPRYYVMRRDQGMAATVAEEMPSEPAVAACAWLPDADLGVYSAEFARTGFQGGLQWYRCGVEGIGLSELEAFAGRTIDVPAMFVAGAQDWGVQQVPGALARMQRAVCRDWRGCHLIEGAGHWVQQEQPARVNEVLLAFLRGLTP